MHLCIYACTIYVYGYTNLSINTSLLILFICILFLFSLQLNKFLALTDLVDLWCSTDYLVTFETAPEKFLSAQHYVCCFSFFVNSAFNKKRSCWYVVFIYSNIFPYFGLAEWLIWLLISILFDILISCIMFIVYVLIIIPTIIFNYFFDDHNISWFSD